MRMDDLKKRCARFIDELGVSVTKFCERIKLSTGGYYAWRNGQLALSQGTLDRIDGYLKQYNF